MAGEEAESWLKPRWTDPKARAVSQPIKSGLGLRAAGRLPFPWEHPPVLGGLSLAASSRAMRQIGSTWGCWATGGEQWGKGQRTQAVATVLVNCVWGGMAETREAAAEGTGAQEVRTGPLDTHAGVSRGKSPGRRQSELASSVAWHGLAT